MGNLKKFLPFYRMIKYNKIGINIKAIIFKVNSINFFKKIVSISSLWNIWIQMTKIWKFKFWKSLLEELQVIKFKWFKSLIKNLWNENFYDGFKDKIHHLKITKFEGQFINIHLFKIKLIYSIFFKKLSFIWERWQQKSLYYEKTLNFLLQCKKNWIVKPLFKYCEGQWINLSILIFKNFLWNSRVVRLLLSYNPKFWFSIFKMNKSHYIFSQSFYIYKFWRRIKKRIILKFSSFNLFQMSKKINLRIFHEINLKKKIKNSSKTYG